MYSNIKSVQILISLLKKFDIKDIVLSPGGSDIPIIHSIEVDSFFTCYSVVDERSAAYFAMGVAQEKNRPCVCVCTSGTAVCNYLPGITEAFYQDVPVVAITADKNPYYQDQLETQKIKQNHIFNDVVKKSVELPVVSSEEDAWLCNRLVNEALLEINHHGTGPVHINIPIVGATNIYDCVTLPDERKITRFEVEDLEQHMAEYANKLIDKRIMVVIGQNLYFTNQLIELFNQFYARYNCIFAVENLSNLKCNGCVMTYPVTEMFEVRELNHLTPDIVISVGNNLAAYHLKPMLRSNYQRISNWLIHKNGFVRDAYKCLDTIFECTLESFLSGILNTSTDTISEHGYYKKWNEYINNISLPEFEFSNFYVAKKLSSIIPSGSTLHLAILNSTRVMQFFNLSEGVTTYSNVGALGIDGCLSTFAGQAAASPDKLAYLLIGDLSFFYDMNAAGLRSISNNVRIILLNNGGGSEFQFFMGKKNIPTIDEYICAEHEKVATGWAWSLGYDYYSASNKEEFDSAIEKFGQTSERPMFLEVFGDMEEEADRTNAMYDKYRAINTGSTNKIKHIVDAILPTKLEEKAKRIIKILKEK